MTCVPSSLLLTQCLYTYIHTHCSYVSAAIVCRFSKTMQGLAFQVSATFCRNSHRTLVASLSHTHSLPTLQELMFFIQRGLPKETAKWTVSDIEEVISQAYINKTLYDKAPKHLQ